MPHDEKSSARIDRQALQRRWIHSHEEDCDEGSVYRPADWRFPPSRGRSGFDLRADGTVRRITPGPTDRPQESGGRWRLESDRLVLETAGPGHALRTLKIVSVAPDRLVVQEGT